MIEPRAPVAVHGGNGERPTRSTRWVPAGVFGVFYTGSYSTTIAFEPQNRQEVPCLIATNCRPQSRQ